MDQFQDKLGAILNDPQMMQQIMNLAQSMNPPTPPPQAADSQFQIDPGMVQKLASLAGSSGMDRNQQALLSALNPYLHPSRIQRLEKAMRAAKTVRMASSILGQDSLSFLTGR